MAKIYMGNLEFNSQEELIAEIKRRFNNFNGYDGFWFVLIERHPEADAKIGCGIKGFFLVCNPTTGEKNHMEFVRFDGTRDHFSWKSCVSGKGKTYNYKLTSAMRFSIVPQLVNFKLSQKEKCALCDESQGLEVDHFRPKFRELVKDFIDNNLDTSRPQDFTEDKACRVLFKDENKDFESQWFGFHAKKAELRMLCRKHNIIER